MKWFKHDSNANTDAKLKRVRMKYGMEGYGLYWYCLELIASGVDTHNLTFELEHDSEIISFDTGIHRERVEEMMQYFVEAGLFENAHGTITCLKMANRTDEYIGKLLRTNSGQTPDTQRRKSRLIEENRIEEIRKEENKEQVGDKSPPPAKWTDEDRQCAEEMLLSIRKLAPSAKGSKKWPDFIRLMRERDGKSHDEIMDMFRWANQDSFWASNILSPAKLREKWVTLEGQRNRHKAMQTSKERLPGESELEWSRRLRKNRQAEEEKRTIEGEIEL